MSINRELYAMIVLHKNESRVNILKIACDLNTIKPRYHEGLQSFWEFLAKYFIARANENTMVCIELSPQYNFYALIRTDGLAVALVTGICYPERMAQLSLYHIAGDFESLVPVSVWTIPGKFQILYTSLPSLMKTYRYPMTEGETAEYGEPFTHQLTIYFSPQQFPRTHFTIKQLLDVHNRTFGKFSLPTHTHPSHGVRNCRIL
jgi:hypothetical protein